MGQFEINGNLFDEKYGLANINLFTNTILTVRTFYLMKIGPMYSECIDLYVDNATAGSGYTPNITCVLNKILMIKLCIPQTGTESQIAFQFAHEYMHYIFYCKYGLQKMAADDREEAICSAASLIVLHNMYPAAFEMFNNYVKNLSNNAYRAGAELAEKNKLRYHYFSKTNLR